MAKTNEKPEAKKEETTNKASEGQYTAVVDFTSVIGTCYKGKKYNFDKQYANYLKKLELIK